MIAFVAGRVAALAPDGAVVEVGGVGLAVQCTPGTLAALRLGEPAQLPTSLVVREDSLTLYGFADEDERVVFELLQTASGVGPRLAQAMLAVHEPDALRRAVATEDLAALTPGARHRPQGRPAHRARAQGPARRRRAAASGAPAVRRVVRPAGATSCTPRCSGWAGPPARPTRRVAAAAPYAEEATAAGEPPDVAALLRSALRSLSRA